MKSLFQSFGYARRKSKAQCRAQFRGENHQCARTSSFVYLPVVPGGLDEAKDVAIEPVVGRAADSKRLARLEAALWTE